MWLDVAVLPWLWLLVCGRSFSIWGAETASDTDTSGCWRRRLCVVEVRGDDHSVVLAVRAEVAMALWDVLGINTAPPLWRARVGNGRC